MKQDSEIFVGLDVAKSRHAVAIAEEGRSGEVRYLGEIDGDPVAVRRMVARLEKRHGQLHFCYEAGPTGYGLYRQLIALGHQCTVVAPSLIPKRPGDRVKTNRRDAIQLAKLLRAGELTAVWVPDETHEGVRELVRSREAAVDDLRRKRQSISSLMLRHGRAFPGKTTWGARHRQWLQTQRFDHPAQQIVLQEMILAAQHAVERLKRIEAAIAEFLPDWSLAPVVDALQALRGVRMVTAAIIMVEIGDLRRFDSPRQLMGYLGLVPGERSTGDSVRRTGHQSRQRPRPAGAGGKCLNLPAPAADQQAQALRPREGASGGARHRIEGRGPAVRSLPRAGWTREEADRCRHGNRPRVGGFRLGDRQERAGSIKALDAAPAAHGWGRGNGRGTPVGRFVAGITCRRPQ